MTGAVKLLTAGNGGINLQPASSIASDVTVNVPSQNCTLGIQGPAFSAYATSSQTVTTATDTKIIFDTEEFDTNSNFSSSRFTPTVAGYYNIISILRPSATTTLTVAMGMLFKNGSLFYRGMELPYSLAGGAAIQIVNSWIVYLNGSTDYIEIYGRIDGTGTCSFQASGTPYTNRIQGVLVRAA